MTHPRIKREEKTVAAMIEIYCRDKHGAKDALCAECDELNGYAMARLAKCPFQENKTTCGKCRVHCYKPEMREKIKEVMRYSGPIMVYKHPVMTFGHLIDGRRKEPAGKGRKKND
jgi:hypothetical protein